MKHVLVCIYILVLVSTDNLAAAKKARPQQQGYAIRAGKILTMAPKSDNQKTPQVINHGIILVSNGKIEAIGPKDTIDIPTGYTIIDASHYWIMPGIVEAHCHVGADMGDLNDMVNQVNPELRASDCVWPEDPGYKNAISGGVTTIHTMPGSGTNQAGFTVILKTDGSDPEKMILREIGAMKATQAFNPERGADLGRSRMAMSWLLRQFMDAAKAYHDQWTAFEQGKTDEKPLLKPQWENLRKVFNKEIPTIVHTYTGWGVMQTMRMFNDEYKLPVIATHTAGGGYTVAREAAKRPDVSINIGPRTVDYGWSEDRDNRFHGMGAEYVAAGVRNFSINTDAVGWYDYIAPIEELASQATISARYGLDDPIALEAITIQPARALMIDDRVGSLQVGKDADIVIKKTSLIDPATPVELVFVNGRIAYQRKGSTLVIQPNKPEHQEDTIL